MVHERRQGTRLRELPRAERRLFLAIAIVVAFPFALGAVAAGADGWYPVGDDAVILTASRQVASAHPPLLGEITSSGKYGVASHHPGPLVFYVYAPFVVLAGGTTGMLVAAAAISASSMILIGYVTLRTAGPARAGWAWVAALATGLSIGGSAYLYRPYKSNAAVLPLLLFLFLAWALVSGRPAFLPLWVLTGCFAASATVQYLVPVAAITVVTVVTVLLDRGRAPPHADRRGLPARLAPSTRRGRATLLASAALALAAWWGPIYEAITDRGGNVRQLLRVTTATDGQIGLRSAFAEGARALVFDPARTGSEHGAGASAQAVAGLLVGAVGVVVLTVAWRRLGRTDRRLALLAATALAAALASYAAYPDDEGFALVRLLALSVAGGFAWFAGANTVVGLAGSPPATSVRWLRLALVASAVLVATTLVPLPLHAPDEYHPWTYRAVPELTDRTERALTGRSWSMRAVGPRSTLVVMDGIAAALEASGHRTDLGRPPGFGARHGPLPGPADGQLLVAPSFLPAPTGGWVPIATYEPDGRDPDEAAAAAEEAAAFVRTAGTDLSPLIRQALPQVLCPQLSFGPGTCPEAEALLGADHPLGKAPPWLAAVVLVEQFDETMPFTMLDVPEPPAGLLDRLRRSWLDIPITIYRHEGPLG
jgi:hypothetical protein